MSNKQPNRVITEQDKENARRLRLIWEKKREELGLTQAKAAKILNVSQPAVSQYLNCHIALNTDITLAWAKMLRVQPGEIDPNLAAIGVTIDTQREKPRMLAVACVIKKGEEHYIMETPPIDIMVPDILSDVLPEDARQYAYQIEFPGLEPVGIKQGDIIYVSPDVAPAPRQIVVVIKEGETFFVGELIYDMGGTIRVHDPVNHNHRVFAPDEFDMMAPVLAILPMRPLKSRPYHEREKAH